MWATLGAAAVATSRVTLLSGFANNLSRHPVDFARGAATVNVLAVGRFEAGLGAGWHSDELRAIGDTLPSPRERVDRLREAVEIVSALFREQACQHNGKHYRVAIEQFPLEGDPPMLVAALGGPRSCRLIAPLVDRVEVMFGPAVAGGSLDLSLFAQLTLDELRSRVETVREASPGVLVGLGVFAAAGSDPQVERLRAIAGTGLQRDLIGEAHSVAAAISGLEMLGVDRVNVVPMTPSTPEALAQFLLER